MKILALGILALSVFTLLVPRAKRQEVRLLDDRIEVQLGIGKIFRIPYGDIESVEERQTKFGLFGRSMIWLGSLRTGVKPLGSPYVWLTFKRRIFRTSWVPFPVPAFAKGQMLLVWETTRLVEELRRAFPCRSAGLSPHLEARSDLYCQPLVAPSIMASGPTGQLKPITIALLMSSGVAIPSSSTF